MFGRGSPTGGLIALVALLAAGCSQSASAGNARSASVAPSAPRVENGRILIGIERGNRHSMAIIDSTGMHTVATAPDQTMAQWDWGGSNAVVFTSERDGHVRHAFWMPIGGPAHRITPLTSAQEMPSVSSDGKWVAYSDYATTGVQDLGLHIARIDGNDPRALTPVHRRGADIADTDPNFSPDGRWVAYAHVANWANGSSAICVVRTDGGDRHCLTGYQMDAGRPRWSPDGRTILFSQGYHAEGVQSAPLWTVTAAGGTQIPLAKHPGGWSFEGDWSPDGTEVVYKYWQPGWDHNELRIVNVATGADQLLWKAPSGETAEMPDWQP